MLPASTHRTCRSIPTAPPAPGNWRQQDRVTPSASPTCHTGLVVMRQTDSVLLTCWPPAPESSSIDLPQVWEVVATSALTRLTCHGGAVWMRPLRLRHRDPLDGGRQLDCGMTPWHQTASLTPPNSVSASGSRDLQPGAGHGMHPPRRSRRNSAASSPPGSPARPGRRQVAGRQPRQCSSAAPILLGILFCHLRRSGSASISSRPSRSTPKPSRPPPPASGSFNSQVTVMILRRRRPPDLPVVLQSLTAQEPWPSFQHGTALSWISQRGAVYHRLPD